MPVAGLPLGPGSSGLPVADLQRRLTALGFPCSGGVFDADTATAVRGFQTLRGLREDGVCGEQTWATVVEAGYRLGDRRLYQRKPMTRGDDVADLQQRLTRLGFDAGKVDGIFGPDTAGALSDFQRNAGLTVDGIFGPDELQVLERLGDRGSGQLRELASLRWSSRGFEHLFVAVGERGGLDGLSSALGRHLRRRGADAIVLHHPEGSDLAQQANAAGATIFVEIASLGAESGCRCVYYHGYRMCSPAGEALAGCLAAVAPASLGVEPLGVAGMALPVLRETRMPAVICEAGPTMLLVERAHAFVDAVAGAIETWASRPLS